MSISEELELAQERTANKFSRVTEDEEYKKELETISQKLYILTKENQGIERKIKVFEQLDNQEREQLRETIKGNTLHSVQLNKVLIE